MTQSEAPSFSELATDILAFDKQQRDFPIHSHDCNGGSESLGSSRLEDMFTRFRLWVGNLGVLHKRQDPRGLDKRLQDAPEVAKRIRELLIELKDLLLQAKVPCECNDPNAHIVSEPSPTNEEDALIMQLLGFETSSNCTASWLLASLEAVVRRLFTISSMIAKSTTRDKFARAEVNCRLQRYEPYDIAHVREKLKKNRADNHGEAEEEEKNALETVVQANLWLADRLGKANTKRRQFLAYSRNHREALNKQVSSDDKRSKRPDENEDSGDISFPEKGSAGKSACLSEGIKSSIARTKASTIADMDPNSFDYGYDDARSCTTVATSIMDDQAFSGLKVPLLSHYSEVGEHFICPMCQTSQRFNGQAAWSKHVFSDIRAYICTSRDCGMLMFDSLSTWRGHEMEHRRKWSCPLCSTSCKEEAATEAHLMRSHCDMVGPHNLESLLRTSSHPSEFLLASDCPFCDWNAVLRRRNPGPEGTELSVPSNRFLKHLGKHLEELALFVVPQPEQDDEDSDQLGSNAVHAAEVDDGTTMSALSSFGSKVSLVDEPLQPETSDIPAPKDWIVADNPHGAPKYGSGATELTPDMLKLPPSKATTLSGSNTPVLPVGISQEEVTAADSAPEPIEVLGSQQSPAALAQEESPQDSKDRRVVKMVHPRHDPPQAFDGKYYCNFDVECADLYFDRKSEWSKHMDKHDRPYRCSRTQCAKLLGFTSSSGLLRHEREVHFNHGGPKEILRCPVDGCKRHVGKAFSRMDGLAKHLGAVHGIKKSSAEIRRDYSFQFDSPDRKESVREHDDDSPGPKLQEDLAPVDYAAEFEREQEQYKLRDLELVNERRLLSLRLEQDDIDTAERHNLQDKAMQLMLLEQQNKKRMLMARQEHGSMLPQSATRLPLSDRFDPQEQRNHDMKSIWQNVEPRGDTVNAEDAAAVLRRHQAQLTTLEQQNEMRVSMAWQKQDPTPPHLAIPSSLRYPSDPANEQRYAMDMYLLEQQNRERLLKALQEPDHDPMQPQPATPLPLLDQLSPAEPQSYKMKLRLLEQQNKKRLLMARQEQDNLPPDSAWFGPPTMPKDADVSEVGDGWWRASKYTEPLMQPRTTHNSENVDQSSFLENPSMSDGSRLSWLPSSLLPSSSTRPNASALPTFELPPPPLSKAIAAQSHRNSFSQQSAPGLVGPELQVPGFGFPGVNYPITGLDNADAGSIASDFARDNGRSPGGQAFLATQHIGSQSVPHPNAQTDRPFRCDECLQSFNRNHDLKRHKRIHEAVRPFPCDFCSKSFSRKEALKRHVLIKGCGKLQPTNEGNDADQELDRPANDQRGQGQEAPPSLAHDFPVQQQQLPDDLEEEDDSQIKCICGFSEDDGNTVACDICNKWQHIICYYPQYADSLPDELQHGCTECRPETLVNAQAAHVRQREARADRYGLRNDNKRQTSKKKATANPKASRAGLVNPGIRHASLGAGAWTNRD